MAQPEPGTRMWRKSTASGPNDCVEVAFAGKSVLVRNSREPAGPWLSFSRAEWMAFLTGVRYGMSEAGRRRGSLDAGR